MLLTSFIAFLILHWTFTSHYLQAATLFRLSFAEKSNSAQRKIHCRRLFLVGMDLIMYSLLVIAYGIFVSCNLGNYTNWIKELQRFRNYTVFSFTLIGIISMTYLQRRSCKLKGMGIHSDSLIMKVYVSLLVLISIGIASSTVLLYQMLDSKTQPVLLLRLNIAFTTIYTLLIVLFHIHKLQQNDVWLI